MLPCSSLPFVLTAPALGRSPTCPGHANSYLRGVCVRARACVPLGGRGRMHTHTSTLPIHLLKKRPYVSERIFLSTP